MFKKSVTSLVSTLLLVTSVSTSSIAADLDMDSLLKEKTSGTSRVRFGGYIGGGYQGALNSKTDTKIQGLQFEAGVYALFNPVKKMFDIEVGLSGKYNAGLKVDNESSGDITYYAGLKQVSVYGGPVIQIDGGRQAVGFGVSKALYIDEVRSKDADELNIAEKDLSNGLGAYLEYQWIDDNKAIMFVRVEGEKFDIKDKDADDSTKESQNVAGIVIGIKF